MDPWTTALLLTACGALYYYLRKKLHFFKVMGVPYCSEWPMLGITGSSMFGRKHFVEVIRDLYNSHPEAKYMGAFDFLRPLIVLRDPELIKAIGIKNFDNFADHNSYVDDTVDPLFGANLFNISGDKWKETRNLISPSFSSSKIKQMYQQVVECARNLNSYLAEQPKDALSMIATKDLFTKYTNDVVATCAFGIKVDSLRNPNNEFYVLVREATNLEGLQSLKFFMARAFPRVMKTLRIKFVNDHVAKFFEAIIADAIDTRIAQGIRQSDILQVIMDARDKNTSKHVKLDITNITAQAFIFFFGGFDTSSTQMCIIAHELTINPDIQKRLQEEIDQVMGHSGGQPSYEDVNSMPYLDAVFNESVRRHSQCSILDRRCVKAFEFPPAVPGAAPFIVQPGMNVWIPAAGLHMDPKYYANPEAFDPDRYFQKKVTMNDVTNLGFGIGPRACIGVRFALLEIKVLFFFLLAKYNLVPNSKTRVPFDYSRDGFVIKPPGGFWLAVEPRD
ncbi:cytochrome P450 9e2-like [Copidosoma floridanum]|uniref:cytochrome P450 9e2-like n=1 Tax=Copidosoma floridanum TaxID=29053 RepID=UPI0006C9B7CD|nr:cytochrome P450 9e2-like [Copidosoma floridanum]